MECNGKEERVGSTEKHKDETKQTTTNITLGALFSLAFVLPKASIASPSSNFPRLFGGDQLPSTKPRPNQSLKNTASLLWKNKTCTRYRANTIASSLAPRTYAKLNPRHIRLAPEAIYNQSNRRTAGPARSLSSIVPAPLLLLWLLLLLMLGRRLLLLRLRRVLLRGRGGVAGPGRRRGRIVHHAL